MRFSASHGGGSSCLTRPTTEVTPFSSKGRTLFESWLKEYTWLVYNRDENLCIEKSVKKTKKSNELSKGSQGRNIQNCALCRQAGLKEHRVANLCLHALPHGYGAHVHTCRSGLVVFWLCYSQDSLQLFFNGSLFYVLRGGRPSVKG